MDRMVSLFTVFMSLYLFEKFAFYYLLAVFFYTITLNNIGKRHRYCILYLLGIPCLVLIVTMILVLLILIVAAPIGLIIISPKTDEYYDLRCVLCFFVIVFLLIIMHSFLLPEILELYYDLLY